LLAEYIPDGFEITQPVVSIQYSECRGVDWLSGGGYHLITVAVPVTYAHGQERIDGLYVLVIWEDQSAPILTGREQTGMPKIFANIEDHHQLGDRLFTNASFEGSAFLRMDFRKTKLLTAGELRALNRQSGKVNAFGWRYIPNIGRPGAALSHATHFLRSLSIAQRGWATAGFSGRPPRGAELHTGPYHSGPKPTPDQVLPGMRDDPRERGPEK